MQRICTLVTLICNQCIFKYDTDKCVYTQPYCYPFPFAIQFLNSFKFICNVAISNMLLYSI
jgi:hypothetical protein